MGVPHEENRRMACFAQSKGISRDKTINRVILMTNEYGEFCKILGATPKNIILEELLALRGIDYGIGDVAKNTGLSRATTYIVMKDLLNEHIIKSSRIIGRTQLYKLNENNPNVKKLIEMFNLLLDKIVDEHKDGELVVEH